MAQRPVEENHLHLGPPKLLDQEHLVRVFAGQPIGGVDIEAVDGPRRNDIAQPFQGWSDQRGATGAFIKELHGLGHDQAIGGDALA